MVHIYNGILVSHKKGQNNAICSNMMQLEIIILSEISQRQIPHDITHMWNLKYDTNEPIYKTETDSRTCRTDLWLPRGREEGEGWTESLRLVDANYYI